MSTLEKYEKVFTDAFAVSKEELPTLEYQGIADWDSVGHMALVGALEDTFDIMMETDDIIDFNSFEKGKELLAKYGVDFSK